MTVTAIIGTGTFGTAMSLVATRQTGTSASTVVLYGRNPEKVEHMASSRQHPRLSAVSIPESIHITAQPKDLASADLVLWAVPTQHSRTMATELANSIAPNATIVSLSKGLEEGSLARLTEIFAETLPGRSYGVLSGPSHAEELIADKPAGLVAAGSDAVQQLILTRLHQPHFRIYTASDMLGVELAGALKNVIAIAAGAVDGLNFGDNVKATLVTRGLAEMRRLGRALGADDLTFAGLAGMGDLLTTCYSDHGRNRAFGKALTSGCNTADILADTASVAEGAWTCRAAVALGQQHGIELPIAMEVESVIWHDKPVLDSITDLLARAAKDENA